jgi:CDP-diacylglycerol--serine O-phosphatidyltransferase
MVAFGLAPSLVIYEWSLHSLGKPGWLAAFVFTAGAALRLARFNTQAGIADKSYFQGLPSPPAAALIWGLVWVMTDYGVPGPDISLLAWILTVSGGVLMVSNVRYRSFKDLDLRNKVPFVAVFIMVLVFVFISIDPPIVLFSMALVYAASGPLTTLAYFRKRRAARLAGAGPIPSESPPAGEPAPDSAAGVSSEARATAMDERREDRNAG